MSLAVLDNMRGHAIWPEVPAFRGVAIDVSIIVAPKPAAAGVGGVGGVGGLTGALSVPVTSALVGGGGGGVQPPSTLVVNGMHAHAHAPSYHTELPVVQVVLSPIQELADSPTSSHCGSNGHAGGGVGGNGAGGGGGTAALAQAVLSPALTTAGLGPVTLSGTPVLATAVSTMTLTPVTMSQPLLTSLAALGSSAAAGSSPMHSLTLHTSLPVDALAPGVTLAELPPPQAHEEDGSALSVAATPGDRSRKTSVASQAAKRGEVYV